MSANVLQTSMILQKMLKGSKHFTIRKSKGKGGITKTAFINSLLSNDDFLKKAQTVINKNPDDKNKIAKELQPHIRDLGHKKVIFKPMARGPDDFKKGNTGKPVVKPLPAPKKREVDMKWFEDVVNHESDRWFKDRPNFLQPKKFSKWDKDPAKAKVQKELVNEFEKAANDGKFNSIKVSGKEGGGELVALELGSMAVGMAMSNVGLESMESKHNRERIEEEQKSSAEVLRNVVNSINQEDLQIAVQAHGSSSSSSSGSSSGSSSSSSSGSSSSSSSGSSSSYSSTRLTTDENARSELNRRLNERPLLNNEQRELARTIYNNSVRDNYNKLRKLSVGVLTDEQMKELSRERGLRYIDNLIIQLDAGANVFDHDFGASTPKPGFAPDPKDIIGGFSDKGGQTRTRPGYGGDPSQTITDNGDKNKDKNKSKTETDQPDPNPPRRPDPPPTGVDPNPKPKKKKKDPKWNPKPVPKGGDSDNDTDDDEDKEKEKEKEKKKKKSIKPGRALLRPFYNIGGQEILNLTKQERYQEIKDWVLYDYILGDSNVVEGKFSDNPLYNHNQLQNKFRFTRNYPNPVYRRDYANYGMLNDTKKRMDNTNPERHQQYSSQIHNSDFYNDVRTTNNDYDELYDRSNLYPDTFNKALYTGEEASFDTFGSLKNSI